MAPRCQLTEAYLTSPPPHCPQSFMGFSVYAIYYLNARFQVIALILETSVCGIYTLLCGYTVWRLLLRKARYTYSFCLIIQWIFIIITLGLDWRRITDANHALRNRVGASGFWCTGQGGAFLNMAGNGSFESSIWDRVNNILSTLVILIADALLIWRSYSVCGGKKWILLVLGIFLAVVFVGACTALIPFRAVVHRYGMPSSQPSRQYPLNYFIMGLLLSSIVITAVGTSLITVRILSATRGNPAVTNRTPYQRIQRIVIESGVIYLTGLLITGVPLSMAPLAMASPKHQKTVESFCFSTGSDPGPLATAPHWFLLRQLLITYGLAVLSPLAGISPALIALRVMMQTPQTDVDDDESQPVSRLTFRRTVRRPHTPAFGTLISSLHLESTWEAEDDNEEAASEDLPGGTSCVADDEQANDVQGPGPAGGELIILQEI